MDSKNKNEIDRGSLILQLPQEFYIRVSLVVLDSCCFAFDAVCCLFDLPFFVRTSSSGNVKACLTAARLFISLIYKNWAANVDNKATL